MRFLLSRSLIVGKEAATYASKSTRTRDVLSEKLRLGQWIHWRGAAKVLVVVAGHNLSVVKRNRYVAAVKTQLGRICLGPQAGPSQSQPGRSCTYYKLPTQGCIFNIL